MIADAHKTSYYIINGITMYRLLSAPIILLLAITGQLGLFKWMIAFSFLTDAIDGPLSRKYKVTSVFGSRLDSVADDATVLVAFASLWIFFPDFIQRSSALLIALFLLFIIQMIVALVAYKRLTSFHTVLAKVAAVVQGVFFIMIFFDFGPIMLAFYTGILITGLQLIEEIVLILILPDWRVNVKGLYWVLRSGKSARGSGYK